MTLRGTSLQTLHTLHLPVYAKKVIRVETVDELHQVWQCAKQKNIPVQLLGEGSNVFFTTDFQGWVVLNRIPGITLSEGKTKWHLHVGAGENWHNLVRFTVQKGIGGLENLALIPGCCGSAPIQNIGAYGVEFTQTCEYVDIVHLQTGKIQRLSQKECQFAYRDSIFKHQYRHDVAIVSIGLCLNKHWQPVLTYGELAKLDKDHQTLQEIFEKVCQIRQSKLPDPQKIGNVGSFFQNPLVEAQQAKTLLGHFPTMPYYRQPDGRIKLAAGWLIEQCGLKGYQLGGAAVHQQQALVLINQHQASCQDVLQLAQKVKQQVCQRFAVSLIPEVRFIGARGEIDGEQAIA